MSEKEALTPRVYLVRHGETEWAKLGRYTGTTDIELSPEGAAQVSSTAATLVGAGKLLDPSRLAHIFVSPMTRAKQTFELLLPSSSLSAAKMTVTKDITEWDYGDYEGRKAEEIKRLWKERGLDREREWSIWRDGCENGESMQQVSERLDRLVSEIRGIQSPYMNGGGPADVLLVAHGLILRCFLKRWLDFPVDLHLPMVLAPARLQF